MTSALLNLQIAARSALINSPAVTALIEPDSIIDGHIRANEFPAISIGEAITSNAGLTYQRNHQRVVMDMHVWSNGESFEPLKLIVAAVTDALRDAPAVNGLVDWLVDGTRFIRDPDGKYTHCIVSIMAIVQVT